MSDDSLGEVNGVARRLVDQYGWGAHREIHRIHDAWLDSLHDLVDRPMSCHAAAGVAEKLLVAHLRFEEGEFFSFLAPSGCGKTTILRAVSGFLDPSEGEVRIGGKNMWGIGPNKRPTALIFQNLALFPLMTVADNIAFGLEVRGVSKFDRRKRADELLNLIALADQGEKLVAALSGGQRQRLMPSSF